MKNPAPIFQREAFFNMEKALFFLKESLKNIFSHKLMNMASIFIVAASLSLFGLFLSIGININFTINNLSDKCEINVYISSNAERSISDIENDLKSIKNVSSVKFFSREDRLDKVKSEIYGDIADVYENGENPLRDSFILLASDSAECEQILKDAQSVDGVAEVIRDSDVINGISGFVNTIKKIGIWIILIFAILSICIIFNTVKLCMIAHEDDIKTMRIIGATDSYIRIPFIVQGALLGIFGAIPACVMTLLSYNLISGKATEFLSASFVHTIPILQLSAIFVPLFLIGGMFIGSFGSLLATRTYFK